MPHVSHGLHAREPARLDTRQTQETPEGVELSLAPAGPLVRGLAWSIDLALRSVVYLAGAIALSFLGSLGAGIGLIAMFLLEWGYPVYFEFTRGCTPGKRLLGLRVVQDDGAPLTLGTATLRNLVRFVDFLPAGYLFGVLSSLMSGRFQRLGDLAAGTLVVYAQGSAPRPMPESVVPSPPPVPLALEEQRAIIAFAERGTLWTAERREELAEHTGSCTRGSPAERVRQLVSYARWIAGDR